MTATIRGTVASVLPTLEPTLEPPFMRIDLDAVRAVVREEVRAALTDNAALRKAAEAASCSNTFDCQCPKHFASQQSEQRPKRVLTAVWRDRAQRAEAQRDALLEALTLAVENGCATVYANENDECGERGCCGVVSYKPHADDCWVTKARAAIKAVEESK